MQGSLYSLWRRLHFIGRWRHLSHDTKEGMVGALRVGQIWFICAALVVMKEESQYLVFAPNHFLVKEGEVAGGRFS